MSNRSYSPKCVTVALCYLSKYSEHIIRTKAAREMFFFSASFFSFSYSSDGILIFNALSFILRLLSLQDYYNTCSESRGKMNFFQKYKLPTIFSCQGTFGVIFLQFQASFFTANVFSVFRNIFSAYVHRFSI